MLEQTSCTFATNLQPLFAAIVVQGLEFFVYGPYTRPHSRMPSTR
jgi:hypothetical protein